MNCEGSNCNGTARFRVTLPSGVTRYMCGPCTLVTKLVDEALASFERTPRRRRRVS